FHSVSQDIDVIIDRLNMIVTRVDEDMLLCLEQGDVSSQQPTDVDTAPENSSQSQTPSTSSDPSTSDRRDDGTDLEHLDLNATSSSEGILDRGQHEAKEQREKEVNMYDIILKTCITLVFLSLAGQMNRAHPSTPDACYVGVPEVLRCDAVDALTGLMVTGTEELVSRVMQLRVQDGAHVSFPVTLVIPFYCRNRGSCRDIVVKVVDAEKRFSYVSPVTSEGCHGGQRGSFAEVKVYSLGLFAVVSCLKRESYTVPRRGLSLKLSMDPRISLALSRLFSACNSLLRQHPLINSSLFVAPSCDKTFFFSLFLPCRLIVVRLLSPLSPCRLLRLVEDLEEAVCCHAVTIALLRRQEDPRDMLVALVPSKDLSWELSKLRAQGYSSSTMDSSSEITMCEGDQLLLRFGGNITSAGKTPGGNTRICKLYLTLDRITFHSQRTNHLSVRLSEVDPFGNHSSSHYKGTAVFHKVNRGQLDWSCDSVIKLQGDPICKLPLTLPKVKLSPRDLLNKKLSAEELSLLAASLRLRRSAAQLVKLRAGNGLSAQAFHLLLMWRRALPAIPRQSNLRHLAQCLAKSGRPDLAEELLLRQAEEESRSCCFLCRV
uniref:Death domain containing 1 n=1 Tax=Neogobius melanostomus TaxID=47308 RepID=A0A8C6UIK6_9GOBI